MVTGQVPASLLEAGLWVNPIHVIDLSMVLRGFPATGVAAMVLMMFRGAVRVAGAGAGGVQPARCQAASTVTSTILVIIPRANSGA